MLILACQLLKPHAIGMVICVDTKDRGLGLSPGPTPCQRSQQVNSNILKLVYIKRNNLWPNGRAVVRRCYAVGGGPGVKPHGLQTFLHNNHTQTMSDTWRPRIGPRVLIPFSIQQTRVTLGFDNCQPINICHITTIWSYGPTTSDRTDWYS
jgi:hypothetical protein